MDAGGVPMAENGKRGGRISGDRDFGMHVAGGKDREGRRGNQYAYLCGYPARAFYTSTA